MDKKLEKYMMSCLETLMAIDSPTGFTEDCAEKTLLMFKETGANAWRTKKGGVMVDLGGGSNDEANGILISGHIDTLGGIVREVKGNGRLRLFQIGGVNVPAAETENVRVYARNGKVYEGTIQLCNASTHVNVDARTAARNFDTVEVVLDEDVKNADDVKALGIDNGCYVCFEPRYKVTESGYIKSRFLDDKLAVAIMLAFAKEVMDGKVKLTRHVYMHITVYEEVGHGAGGIAPEDVCEYLAIDMGCVGDSLQGDEKKVSICCADGSGPYDAVVTQKLVALAEEAKLNYAVDVYQNYSSDASVAVRHVDLKHGLIGPGVYASHGYERSHVLGATETVKLLELYLKK